MTFEIVTAQATAVTAQAHSDQQLITLWLYGKSPHSQYAYRTDVARLLAFTTKPLASITLGDLQDFADSLLAAGLSPNSRKRSISSVKSLFTFGQRLGYLQFNVGAALKAPKVKNTLAERILTEEQVISMVALTTRPRDRLIIRLLYSSAARLAELCALRWVDVQPNGDTGQLALFGKGGNTRFVKLSSESWKALQAHRQGAPNDAPVFISQKGGPLDSSQVHRIIKAAAKRAGIAGNVSAHWLRHSHASHAIDRGASIAVVRDTLDHSSLAVTSRYVHAKPGQSSSQHLVM